MSNPHPDVSPETSRFAMAEHINAATKAANVALWSNCPATGETWFSDVWYTLLGYAPGDFTPSFDKFLAMMHVDDQAPTIAAFMDLVEDRTPAYAADFRLRAANGQWRWIGATGAKVQTNAAGSYVVYGMQTDITNRKLTEAKLAQTALESERDRSRLARLAENSPAALFEFRIGSDGHISMPFTTSGMYEILDVDPLDVQADGPAVFRNIFEEDQQRISEAIELSRISLEPFRMRYRVHRKDVEAGFIWVQANSMPHRDTDGATTWFGSIYDATPEVAGEAILAETRDAMQHLALHDGLTGLPNRRCLDDALRLRSSTERLTKAPLTVLIRIDLDRFKYVNDTLGHAAGDAVLCHVASVLRDSTGNQDLSCRVGGDEFCILMGPGSSLTEARSIVTRIQTYLSRPFLYDQKLCRFGASFGIATSEHGDIANGDLMSFADAALYKAKTAGRGRLEEFGDALHDEIRQARLLASEIETALANRCFVPFFQPQICAHSGALLGAEVLARWRLESGQIVTPDKFLPISEQIRAVPHIDKMMMQKAQESAENWHESGLLIPKLSFNVSAGRLQDTSLVSDVAELQALGVQVAFELLESILLEEEDSLTRHTLDLAREAGIKIEVDDFGTGHASILGLLKVGPEVLKIDRLLTANVVETDQARQLVSSILGIAKSLGIHTIAEGIETAEQAAVLKDLGCFMLQGFHFAPPLPEREFFDWARNQGFVQDGLSRSG